MITTSVSLPTDYARIWRRHKRSVMQCACRTLRLTMRQGSVRRAVARGYNRGAVEFQIVTTRFTPAEYDSLHYVASAMRISVSLLVCWIIKMYLKPTRRKNRFVTNYEYFPVNWGQNAGILTEALIFYRKIDNPRQSNRSYFLIPRQ